jgi:hypothetical protein
MLSYPSTMIGVLVYLGRMWLALRDFPKCPVCMEVLGKPDGLANTRLHVLCYFLGQRLPFIQCVGARPHSGVHWNASAFGMKFIPESPFQDCWTLQSASNVSFLCSSSTSLMTRRKGSLPRDPDFVLCSLDALNNPLESSSSIRTPLFLLDS